MVAVLTVASPFLLMTGPQDPSGGPGPTEASPLPSVEEMILSYQGDPGIPSTYSAMAGLFRAVVGYGPNVGGLGHVVSVNYTVHEGKRWDYAVVQVQVPEGRVTLEVRDPANSTFPDDPVLLRSVAAPGSDSVWVDLRSLDPEDHVQLQIAVILDHSGRTGQPPSIYSWSVGESDPDLWHDPFLDVGRDESRNDLVIFDGACRPIGTHKPGGLLGDYYDNRDFTSFEFQRLDQTIDFDWGNSGPGGGMGRNTFSIRWEGKLMVPAIDTYTFYLRVDDGGRLWIDGNLVIDEWRDQGATEFSTVLFLDKGLHDIRLDYYENQATARCELRWSSSTISKSLVPHTALWGRTTTNVLVSEDIQLPAGHAWDLLMVETRGGSAPLYYDLFDAHNDVPIPGYQCLTAPVLDLSGISAGVYPRIHLRARWSTGDTAVAPALTMWGVKWMPERTWRAEFITDIKLAGMVGLARREGYVVREGTDTQTSVYAFAESFDGVTDLVDSTVRKGEYWQQGIPTVDATDVAMGDLDGDGLDDIVFTSGRLNTSADGYRATAGGFATVPTWSFPHLDSVAAGSYFSHVLIEDLDADDDMDVILVAKDTISTVIGSRLLLFYNNPSGFNTTPDEYFGTHHSPISSVSSGDIDGDGLGDIAVGHASTGGNGFAAVWYGSDDWTQISDQRWSGNPVLSVHVGDLNGDRYGDLFIGANLTQVPAANNCVYYGTSSGIPADPDTTFDTDPCFSATYADWNGDSRRDVVMATEDHARVYYGGTSGFTTGPIIARPGVVDVTTIRAGGDDDEDVAFAGADPAHYDNSGYMEAIGTAGVFTRLLHTHNATAVASGDHLADDVGSLRTEIIDLGDPEDVGDWDQLSYRTPGGQADFQVTVRLLDASTEEVLFEKTSTDTNPSFDVSSVSAEDHPRVVIELLLKNQQGFGEARLDHLEINWTDRLPEAPRMLSLSVDNGTIYRTNGTTLRLQASDERDRPQYLKLTVQMRPPGGGGWISDRLGDPVWDGGNWTVPFSTTRDDATGNYSFRAWVTDSDMLSSPPLEGLDLVTVVNNPPGTPGIGILPGEPLTDEDLSVTILRQAYDRDTSYMEYEYRWYRDGEEMTDLRDGVVPWERTGRSQVWKVRVRAFDGEEHGPWVEAEVTIGNSPPRLLKDLGPIELLEDDPPVVLRIRDHIVDPDGDLMEFEHFGAEAVEVAVDTGAGTLTISVPPDWFGTDTVTLNVTDGDAILQVEVEVRVEPVRDPPVVVSIGGVGPVDGRFHLEAMQGVTSVYLVVVEDRDSDQFRFRSDARYSAFELVTGNGTIIYTPTNGEVGTSSFNLSVEDWESNSVVVPVDIHVTNVNDPPGPVQIIQPKSGMTFEHDATVLLQGKCEDPDEQYGQILTFTWLSSIDGELDRGMNVQVSDLSPGDHQLTLEVTDGEYTRDKSIQIRVKAPPDEPDNGGPDNGDPDDGPVVPSVAGGGLLWLVVALLLIVLVGVMVLYRRRRSTAAAAPAIEVTKDTDDEIRMVDGIPVSMLGAEEGKKEPAPPGTDLMSVVMGRSARSRTPEEDIPSSPWSADDLDYSKRPMPSAPAGTRPPPPPPAQPPEVPRPAAAVDPSEWEEEVEEEHVVRPPPPPPPPPPRSGTIASSPPTPPSPGVPSRKTPPKEVDVEEVEWEEVD